MPRVSVIIPSYNHARYLERRIRSVLEQTFQDFELLLLDDASTDDSLQILRSFLDDPRVSLHVNARNSGSPFPQWNKGVNLAIAPLIWIAEADDDADPLLLQTLVHSLDQDPGLVLAYAQSAVIDESGTTTGTMADWTRELDADRWLSDFTHDGRQECMKWLIHKNTIPNASAVLFRRDAYLRAGSAPEHMRVCGDWHTWARLLHQGRLAFSATPLNKFRQHRATVRATVSQQAFFEETLAVRHWLTSLNVSLRATAAALTRADWWQTVHHHPHAPPLGWRWRQAWRASAFSPALPVQLLAMAFTALLLRTRPGKALLRRKQQHSATA
jgi:hypothetical protein